MPMRTKTQPMNNIKTFCEEKGISARELAKKIGTSAPHMSRLINGKSPLTIKWLLKISAVLKVPTSKIAGVDVDMGKKFANKCDDTLLGSIIGWLLEASDDIKTDLSRRELGKLTSFIYKESIETPLNFNETRYLAFTAVRIKQVIGK
jgi:transcriptional regulator with XRE-family HTH domain